MLSAAASVRITSGGVPAGTKSPLGVTASKFATPCSCNVGTLGRSAMRERVPTASARSLPAWICASELEVWSIIESIWPPMRSMRAGPDPL